MTQPKYPMGLYIERPEGIEYAHGHIDRLLRTKSFLTLMKRKIRLEIFRLIPNKTTHSVNEYLKEIDSKYLSITSDTGKEFWKLSTALE